METLGLLLEASRGPQSSSRVRKGANLEALGLLLEDSRGAKCPPELLTGSARVPT